MKISTAEYFITESLNSIRRNGLMSLASLMTVALSLLILGVFIILVMNLNHMASVLESQVQVTVYLQDTLKEVEVREIGTRITKLPGVTRVNFIAKEEAMNRFKQRLGEQQGLLAELVKPIRCRIRLKSNWTDRNGSSRWLWRSPSLKGSRRHVTGRKSSSNCSTSPGW